MRKKDEEVALWVFSIGETTKMDENVEILLKCYNEQGQPRAQHLWARGYGKTVHLWKEPPQVLIPTDEFGGVPASVYAFRYEVFPCQLSLGEIDVQTCKAKDSARQRRWGSANNLDLPEEHAERNELASKFLSREDEDYPALIKELGGSS